MQNITSVSLQKNINEENEKHMTYVINDYNGCIATFTISPLFPFRVRRNLRTPTLEDDQVHTYYNVDGGTSV